MIVNGRWRAATSVTPAILTSPLSQQQEKKPRMELFQVDESKTKPSAAL